MERKPLIRRSALALGLALGLAGRALPAAAIDILTADEFESYVTGRTLTWSLGADVWGVEEYLPGRGVQWSPEPGRCVVGRWYAMGEAICFAYEEENLSSCWVFRRGPQGLTADLQGPHGPLLLHESGQSEEGLPCPGPGIGV